MQIIHSIEALRQWRKSAGTVAFVPTMGNLHEGHLALVREAKKRADNVVVSIFVNRLQFGQGEDFDQYPRTLQQDADKLKGEGVAVVFAPDEKALYPRVAQRYNVEPPNLQNELCGKFRPGHFRGVATVVMKLFSIVQPQAALFGKKDYQQFMVLSAMVREFGMPIEVIPGETVRAPDGLALSSRNGYLTPAERAEAPRLSRTLQSIRSAVLAGERDFARLETAAVAELDGAGWQTDYVAIRRQADLQPPTGGEKALVVLAASRLGTPRLIDNLEIDLP